VDRLYANSLKFCYLHTVSVLFQLSNGPVLGMYTDIPAHHFHSFYFLSISINYYAPPFKSYVDLNTLALLSEYSVSIPTRRTHSSYFRIQPDAANLPTTPSRYTQGFIFIRPTGLNGYHISTTSAFVNGHSAYHKVHFLGIETGRSVITSAFTWSVRCDNPGDRNS